MLYFIYSYFKYDKSFSQVNGFGAEGDFHSRRIVLLGMRVAKAMAFICLLGEPVLSAFITPKIAVSADGCRSTANA